MFRKRQKLKIPAFGAIKYQKYVPSSDNSSAFVSQDVDAVDDNLPCCENFKLGTLLKAGIPLERVDSQVISGDYSQELSNMIVPEQNEQKKVEEHEN